MTLFYVTTLRELDQSLIRTDEITFLALMNTLMKEMLILNVVLLCEVAVKQDELWLDS